MHQIKASLYYGNLLVHMKFIYVLYSPHVRGKGSDFCHFVPLRLTTIRLVINPTQAPHGVDSFCWWMVVELTQEGSWKWILSIILVPVSWLVAGMVSLCSCLLGSPSQNPGMVSKCVDVRARCHLGNMDWRDDGDNSLEFRWTGRCSYTPLWWRHQTPVLKMNGFQFYAPSPLVS